MGDSDTALLHNQERKLRRPVAYQQLHEALFVWIKAIEKVVTITGPVLQAKAAEVFPYLAEVMKTIWSYQCWCGSGERQSRHHLFIKCRAWEAQIRELWKCVGKACKWKHPRAPTVRLLF